MVTTRLQMKTMVVQPGKVADMMMQFHPSLERTTLTMKPFRRRPTRTRMITKVAKVSMEKQTKEVMQSYCKQRQRWKAGVLKQQWSEIIEIDDDDYGVDKNALDQCQDFNGQHLHAHYEQLKQELAELGVDIVNQPGILKMALDGQVHVTKNNDIFYTSRAES